MCADLAFARTSIMRPVTWIGGMRTLACLQHVCCAHKGRERSGRLATDQGGKWHPLPTTTLAIKTAMPRAMNMHGPAVECPMHIPSGILHGADLLQTNASLQCFAPQSTLPGGFSTHARKTSPHYHNCERQYPIIGAVCSVQCAVCAYLPRGRLQRKSAMHQRPRAEEVHRQAGGRLIDRYHSLESWRPLPR